MREAAAADAVALVALLAELHPRYPGDPGQAATVIDQARAQPGRSLLVAASGGRVVGTADLITAANITHGGRPWGIVENVVVAADARGTGVGAALLAEVVERAESAGCYMLQLVSLNHRVEAHGFYRRLGFTPVAAGFRRYLAGFAATETDD